MTHHTTHTTTTTTTRRRGLFSRRPHTTTTSAPVHHHKRHATLGDKISGAMLKLKGTLTRRPGVKAAGTRRMRGTDGRGSHHHASRVTTTRRY
ncbi:Uu.00g097070.m01.CDS01 [Anthostomella pinea]|uniref:Uu.00g097070.m01.CDS01 n=1 Tax=Anthostomella pinea TaxID=933095 RepID=A0AAI8V7A6_9PEZI|nr:Uu.00g097070.m01.CDS01 [Anthostomella pinea]